MSLADDLKKQTKNFRTKKIDYQVDTVRVGKWAKTASGGYYRPDTGTITLNYHEDNETLRHKAQDSRETILYHEQKHRSNADKGFKSENINISPKQYYKLCMADEISANMAELVYLREKYIQTGDINLFDKGGKKFSFYKEAVQKGEINPLSSDSKDFEKDMSLIMNGTQEMWTKEFAEAYSEIHINMAEGYLNQGDRDFKRNDAEYQKQLDIAYTIGGVNFKQYMQKDAEIPNNWKTKESLDKFDFIEKMEGFPFKDNMSFEQYGNLLQHLYIANIIKENSEKTLKGLNADNVNNLDDEQRQEYLTRMKEYTEHAKIILSSSANSKHKESIEVINIGLNRALEQRGGQTPENEVNYQAALKKAYNVNGVDYYSLLNVNPKEKMPLENYIKEFEKRSSVNQCVDKVDRWNIPAVKKVVDLFKKNKNSKKHLKNYPEWSEDERVSEIKYEKIIDLDKPVITQPKTVNKNTDKAEKQPNVSTERAAYLKSLSGRTQQDSTARVSPSFSRMRDSKSSMELMLLRRQMGR